MLVSGGTVTNETGGTVTADFTAVEVAGAAGTVSNFGTVQSLATGTFGNAVYLQHGGSVTNGDGHSTAALIAAASRSAIVVEGSAGTITNFGRIENTSTSRVAIYLAGGTVTNGRSGSATALIKSPTDAVLVRGAAGTITNFGTIDGVSNGVALDAGGTVANHGLIEGGAAGVYLGATTSAGRIFDSGTVKGKIGVAVGAGDTAGNALTNAGTIVGSGGTAVAFGAGNDVLTVDAGAVFKGAVNGGGGRNKLVEGAAGTLTVTGFSGFETIVLADGGLDTLTLKSANFDGVTKATITVEDGNMGNTVSAAGEAAGDRIVVHAGIGLDALTGGPGNDVFYAGGDTTMTGRAAPTSSSSPRRAATRSRISPNHRPTGWCSAVPASISASAAARRQSASPRPRRRPCSPPTRPGLLPIPASASPTTPPATSCFPAATAAAARRTSSPPCRITPRSAPASSSTSAALAAQGSSGSPFMYLPRQNSKVGRSV